MLNRTAILPPLLLVGVALGLVGCNKAQNLGRLEYPMGERVRLGPLTYNVVESAWRSQLGDALNIRVPDQRFLVVTISATNGGGKDISIPLLSLENDHGQTFLESDNGAGVENWLGLLRTLNPAQTQQGRIVFDIPLASYRLRLTDGGEPGSEKFAWVEIPLTMDTDTGVQTPMPGNLGK